MDINYRDWIELANKVFDQEVVPAEAVFVHGLGDMHEKLINFVADLYKNSGAKHLVMNGEKEFEIGSSGWEYWKDSLSRLGVPKENMYGIKPALQTRDEAVGFMNFAKNNNLNRAIVTSVPFHVIRAFLTNLSLLEEWKLNLQLYPVAMKGINWEEKITLKGLSGDSPKEPASRVAKFAGEWGKIIQYRQNYENGDPNYSIASIKEGLNYIKTLSS